MKFGRTASVEDLQIVGRFEGLRKILLSEAYSEHLDKPLAYWALPNDRRLPLALLGRPLGDLLNTPLAKLSATPGIGQKKITSLVRLLARAANTDPAELPAELVDPSSAAAAAQADKTQPEAGDGRFDPLAVSEVSWAQWRATVVRHGMTAEPLGHLAPSLQTMTRVIWNTPLGVYTSSTLAEIRAMKTHGEKRVRAILEVFHVVHTLVSGMGSQEHLLVRIVPRRIERVERWMGRTLQRPGIPSRKEIFAEFIEPLLEQIRIDASRQVTALAESRLGIDGPLTSVRQVARTMGLTRARVYQLLNEINDVMMVRWPTGRHQVHELRERFAAETPDSDGATDLRQFHAAVELFYPGSRRGASGPLELTFDSAEQDDELLEVSQATDWCTSDTGRPSLRLCSLASDDCRETWTRIDPSDLVEDQGSTNVLVSFRRQQASCRW
jgi:hypothetical protein